MKLLRTIMVMFAALLLTRVVAAEPRVKLVALFGPEHGIYDDVPAGDKVASSSSAADRKQFLLY